MSMLFIDLFFRFRDSKEGLEKKKILVPEGLDLRPSGHEVTTNARLSSKLFKTSFHRIGPMRRKNCISGRTGTTSYAFFASSHFFRQFFRSGRNKGPLCGLWPSVMSLNLWRSVRKMLFIRLIPISL